MGRSTGGAPHQRDARIERRLAREQQLETRFARRQLGQRGAGQARERRVGSRRRRRLGRLRRRRRQAAAADGSQPGRDQAQPADQEAQRHRSAARGLRAGVGDAGAPCASRRPRRRSMPLLDAGDLPVGRVAPAHQVPDLVEVVGRAAGFLADLAVEAHADHLAFALLLEVEHVGVHLHHVGRLRLAAAILDVQARHREHLGRGEGAQVVQVAGIVGRLHADEDRPGRAAEALGVEAGRQRRAGRRRIRPQHRAAVGRHGAAGDGRRGCRRALQHRLGALGRLRLVRLRPTGSAGCGRLRCAAAAISQRMPTKAAIASSASIRKLANSAPRPRWLISAASPRPAARPAIGPIQLRLGVAAAAVAPAGLGAVVGAACCGAARVAGRAGGLDGRLRCMPLEPPPPKRLASASVGAG